MAEASSSVTRIIKRPIQNAVTANWDLALTYEDYNKLLKGFLPKDMDDKWVCVTETPDANGNTVVHIARSWTGYEYTSITVEAGNPDETKGDDWGKITSVTWNSETLGDLGEQITEKEAKEEAVGFSRGLMECKLDSAGRISD